MQHASAYHRSNGNAARSHSTASIWSELVDAMPIVIFVRGLRAAWKDRRQSQPTGAADRGQQDVHQPRPAP